MENEHQYFANYFRHQSDLTIDLKNNTTEIHNSTAEPWKISLIDTGVNTMTGGRIKRIQSYIGNEPFLLTYGDGVSDVNLKELVEFHQKSGKLLTVTSIQPTGRFGSLEIDETNTVQKFVEKPKGDGAWINAGFFVCEPSVFDFIHGDETIFEKDPLEKIAEMNQLMAFKHDGFWKPMDSLRDKYELENLWQSNKAPWKTWK